MGTGLEWEQQSHQDLINLTNLINLTLVHDFHACSKLTML